MYVRIIHVRNHRQQSVYYKRNQSLYLQNTVYYVLRFIVKSTVYRPLPTNTNSKHKKPSKNVKIMQTVITSTPMDYSFLCVV